MLKNKKRLLLLTGVAAVVIAGIVCMWKISTNSGLKEDEKNIYDRAMDQGYSGDVKAWTNSIVGKSVIVKSGTWWIDDCDTGVHAKDEDAGQKGVIVTDCFKKDGHIWIKFSDGRKIDGGKIDADIEPLNVEYCVEFRDFDGSLLKEEKVKRGGAAHPPESPRRKGFKFDKWDKSYEKITENTVITAQYISQDSPVLISAKVEVKPGEKGVKIPVKIEKNPGILGMEITVSYDEKAMKLVEASNGRVFKGVLSFTKGKLLQSGCKFVWDGQEIQKEQVKDGEILVLYFDIPETAPKGTYLIDITYEDGNIVDNTLSPVAVNAKGGEVIIQ